MNNNLSKNPEKVTIKSRFLKLMLFFFVSTSKYEKNIQCHVSTQMSNLLIIPSSVIKIYPYMLQLVAVDFLFMLIRPVITDNSI